MNLYIKIGIYANRDGIIFINSIYCAVCRGHVKLRTSITFEDATERCSIQKKNVLF